MDSQTAKAKFAAKLAAMPTGMLALAVDDLSARRGSLDPAESYTLTELSIEYARRLRVLAAAEPTRSLRWDLERLAAKEYRTMAATEQKLYWAITDQLESRYPVEAGPVLAWFDALTPAEIEAAGESDYERRLLAAIPTE